MVKLRHVFVFLASLASLTSIANAGPVVAADTKVSSAQTATQTMTATILSSSGPQEHPVVTVTQTQTTITEVPATTTTPALPPEQPTSTVNITEVVPIKPPGLDCWYLWNPHVGNLHWFVQAPMIHDDDIHDYCGGLWDNLHHRSCTASEPFCGLRRQPLWFTPGGVGVEPDDLGGGAPAYGTGLFWQFTTAQTCVHQQVEEAFYEATYGGKFGRLRCPEHNGDIYDGRFNGSEDFDPELFGHNPYVADYNDLPILGRRSFEFDAMAEYNVSSLASVSLNKNNEVAPVGMAEKPNSLAQALQLSNGTGSHLPKQRDYKYFANLTEDAFADLVAPERRTSEPWQDRNLKPPRELMGSAAGPEWHYNTSCMKIEWKKDMQAFFNVKAPKVPMEMVHLVCAELKAGLKKYGGRCNKFAISHQLRCGPLHPERGGIWWNWMAETWDCHRHYVEDIWMDVTQGVWGALFCYGSCDPIIDGTWPRWCRNDGVGDDSPCC